MLLFLFGKVLTHHSLEDSPAWTRGDIINQAKQVVFQARKVGH